MTKYAKCLVREVENWDWGYFKEQAEISDSGVHIGWLDDLMPVCGKQKPTGKDIDLFLGIIDSAAHEYKLSLEVAEHEEIWLKLE